MSEPKPNLDDLRISGRDRTAATTRPRTIWFFLTAVVLVGAAVWWFFGRPKPIEVRVVITQGSKRGYGRTNRSERVGVCDRQAFGNGLLEGHGQGG